MIASIYKEIDSDLDIEFFFFYQKNKFIIYYKSIGGALTRYSLEKHSE